MTARENHLRALGLVLIGRNEGERLRLCLESIPDMVGGVVYVDSGSTDGSVELAQSRGVSVVNLDMSQPFTAARARNEGFEHLMRVHDSLDHVQFVDGDCSLADGWLVRASELLDTHADWLAVCGWRRERFPDASVYNLWCDLEWTQAPVGDVDGIGFGGDVMIRISAFREVGGYNAAIIAGEDPDLSGRLCELEGRVVRVDHTMTHHDANIQSLGQYWSRSVRSGHAYAEVSARHTDADVFGRNMRSLFVWGVVMPTAFVVSLVAAPVGAVMVLGIYAVQIFRVAVSLDATRFTLGQRLSWGVSCLLSQVPKMLGMMKFQRNRRLGVQQEIIEYK
ncbi:MAG: glycosyltransferase family A protein [Myxococcota bacterium]